MSELPTPEEPLPDEDTPADAAHVAPELRRYPSTVGGFLYLLVLVTTGVGVWISWTDDWRFGVKCIGAALVFAGLVRLVLRQRDAGMLAVRHRWVDVLMLAGVGVTLIVLTESIPNQPL